MAGHSRNIDEYVAAKWLGLAGAAAGVVGLIPLWDTRYRYWVIAIAVVFGSILVWSQLIRGRLSIFSSGLVSFVADFKENKNAEVFATITQNYDYLGYSFDTVSKPFEIWFRDDRKGNLTIRILLADPAWDGLDFQSRFDPCEESLSKKAGTITNSLQKLSRLPGSDTLRVRLHREKLHEWMHCVDGTTIYLGFLRTGKSNLRCPVAVLESGRGEMFDHYKSYFDLLWAASGNDVDLSKYRAS